MMRARLARCPRCSTKCEGLHVCPTRGLQLLPAGTKVEPPAWTPPPNPTARGMRALGRGLAMLVFMVLIGLTFTLLIGQ
jgi:hypothetical protein